MSTLETIVVGVLLAVALLIVVAMASWWLLGRRGRALARRVGELPMRRKAELAGSLFGDPRLPIISRAGLALLIGYLALPIDLIPDFIPVLGQVDDVVMLLLGGVLLVRSVPSVIIDEHLARIEAEVRGSSPGS